ncbi:MAG: KUP/HAK/KT family potassium transporter [Tatlockia sp.]|nr:KUP/HAK/KT family potassium transporter [Tatlockia sp.]
MSVKTNKFSWVLSLGALGIVFGDIGTSPLYALRETLGNFPINRVDVLGVLSLIFWSLIVVISIKYLVLVLRADNEGEGGGLALLALIKQKAPKNERVFYLLGIFSAGLLLGDAMLTPAISVTSAIEGLKLISPEFDELVVPLSAIILFLLFFMQSYGTEKIGAAFGPILLVWFIIIAVLGMKEIIKYPEVLQALNPYYAVEYLFHHGYKGYVLLGGVFLVVTGGEALYADIGHFGKSPIRYAWFTVALPSLVLNYFGQGAHLISHPESIINPFYRIAPEWFFIPLLIISAMATVIASQAVISATFSLTKQAILLGLCPRIPVIQTSKKNIGQIYIPQMNLLLLIGTLLLVFTFRSSSNMTHAYGIAVNLVMLLVTAMVTYAAHHVWGWTWLRVAAVFIPLILIDLAFLGANAHKFLTGGWVPVCFALSVSIIMYTWNQGLKYLKKHIYLQRAEVLQIIRELNSNSLAHLPGITTIFITDTYDTSGGSFLKFVKLSHAVPEKILIISYIVANKPHVEPGKRIQINPIDNRVCEMILHYGFMDNISVPRALARAVEKGMLPFKLNVDVTTYMVEVPNVIASRKKKTLVFYWQERLFAFLMRNYSANLNIEFYKLPYNRTIAIGTYCKI